MIYCVFTTTSHAARGISDYKHEAKAKKQVCVSVCVLTCIEKCTLKCTAFSLCQMNSMKNISKPTCTIKNKKTNRSHKIPELTQRQPFIPSIIEGYFNPNMN